MADLVGTDETWGAIRSKINGLVRFGEFATIGDSLPAGGYAGSSFAQRVAQRSGGRFKHRLNFAVGGKNSTEVLAEQVPLLIASGYRFAIIDCGVTNDIAQGVAAAASRSNTLAIWAALKAAGIYFVDFGMFPSSVSTSRALLHADHEIWAGLAAGARGIPHLNPMLMFGAPDGSIVSGAGFDNTHPNSIAANTLADAILAMIDRPVAMSPLLELVNRGFAGTVPFQNAVNFGGPAAALPSGYTASGSGAIYSVIPPDSGQQNGWLRATFAGAATLAGFTGAPKSMVNLGVAQGDKVAFGCLARWQASAQDGMKPRLPQISNTGATLLAPLPYDEWGDATGASITVYGDFLAGTGPNVNTNFLASPNASGGYFEISRPILYNLTANGLA